ncbi:GNAT family N-acetyltransferase [Pseudorhodobacter aquimaris]|uniref:GNAT family N-acetyltransferase n=1 Tax=Pseudorhodobacter aquimaris TaxID=687412 RepID=UPI00067D4CE9|nr:GNAT family N-acetyltransferase [Pseudorhodobacter aquimaris]
MNPDDLATLHACSFTTPPPWSARAFAELLDSPGTFIRGDARGFVLGRAVAGEAEVLTLAVAPAFRRKGLARRLMAAFHDAARPAADIAFLEVAQDNDAAIALYHALGYTEVGRRPRYFEAPQGLRVDALVMHLSLRPPA